MKTYYFLLALFICLCIYYYSRFNNPENMVLSELKVDELEMRVDSLEIKLDSLIKNK